MQRILIYSGLIIVALGLLWPWLIKLPLGRLPGGYNHRPAGFKLYIPVTTMILISIVLSLLSRIFKK